jgi:hypothetical protein
MRISGDTYLLKTNVFLFLHFVPYHLPVPVIASSFALMPKLESATTAVSDTSPSIPTLHRLMQFAIPLVNVFAILYSENNEYYSTGTISYL